MWIYYGALAWQTVIIIRIFIPLEEYDILDSDAEMIVYVDPFLDEKTVIDTLLKMTNYTSYDFLVRGSGTYWEEDEAYYIYRMW